MSKLFIAGILLFLLLAAAGSQQTTLAARYIPWDCADWQAFAHDDRTTAILESLAENRGKTLYCGIDQSDTFSKAETWAAGRDHNERDDTVYWGERGSFRGFIAAQEGWLTDGESGITGQSIATIFEFPRAPRRAKRVKRLAIGSGDIATDTCMTDLQEGRQPGTLICSDWGTNTALPSSVEFISQSNGRNFAVGRTDSQVATGWTLDWQTNIITDMGGAESSATPGSAQWMTWAQAAARSACRRQGYPLVTKVAVGPGHSRDKGSGNRDHGDRLGWFYWDTQDGANYKHRARQSRTWSATCKKVIRRAPK